MGQKWPTCDAAVAGFVEQTVSLLKQHLQDHLAAIYLHGSLAMGSYYPPKSDIDLLILVHQPLSGTEQEKLHLALMALNATRPTVGALELSIITTAAAKNPVHPIPYELHFSSSIEEKIKNKSVDYTLTDKKDPDLGAHVMVTKKRGLSLFGPPPAETIGDISWDDYMAAVMDDFNWIIDGENILTTPFYCILNACRVLQMKALGPGTVASKEEGALWVLKNLPVDDHRRLIEDALMCYRDSRPVTPETRQKGGRVWNPAELLAFRDYIRVKAAT